MARNQSDNELLARLDERTANFAKTLDFMAAENRELSKAMLAALETHKGDDNTRFDRADMRLKILENWRWWILGAMAIIGIGISILR
jgi:hypothetical protein